MGSKGMVHIMDIVGMKTLSLAGNGVLRVHCLRMWWQWWNTFKFRGSNSHITHGICYWYWRQAGGPVKLGIWRMELRYKIKFAEVFKAPMCHETLNGCLV